MVFSHCSTRFRQILILIFLLSVLSIFYLDFSVPNIASKLKNVASMYSKNTTKISIIPLSSLLRRFTRQEADDKNKKPDRTEMLREAVEGMRNLPRVPYVAEYPSPSLTYNESCAMFPSILDIQFTNAYWQRANTSWGTFFMYGAYYDNRSLSFQYFNAPVVRILGVMEHYIESNKTTDYCHLWFGNEDKPVITQIAEKKYIWHKGWGTGRKYHSFLFACPIPATHHRKVPKSASVVAEPCENALNNMGVQYEKPDAKKGFAICVKGYDFPKEDHSIRLVEWIELNRLLGAEKIFFYRYDPIHPNVSMVLEYYKSTGFVDVTPYTLPGYLPDEPKMRHFYLTGYYRIPEVWRTELLPYNDCLYRNLYNYEYLSVVDTDEIIMPLKNISTWNELVNVVEKEHPKDFQNFGAICFRNVYFFDYWMKDKPLFADIPSYMHMLQHVYRANNYSLLGHAAKCFHKVEKVDALHNHYPIGCINKCHSVNLEPTQAQLQHYKTECPSAIANCSQTIGSNPVLDSTIWRYRNVLTEKVTTVLKNLGLIFDLKDSLAWYLVRGPTDLMKRLNVSQSLFK